MVSENLGLLLRGLVEGIKWKNLPAIISFGDFRQAFDSVHRGKGMDMLTAGGVPVEIADAVNMVYTNTFAQVVRPGEDTESLKF